MTTLTNTQLVNIIREAKEAAHVAASKQDANGRFGGCGFSWVEVLRYNGKKVDGRSKIGKMLESNGFRKNYNRTYQMWNPSGLHTQNVDALCAGSEAFAKVFSSYGFDVYSSSRLD
jgi:hypothetical protein